MTDYFLELGTWGLPTFVMFVRLDLICFTVSMVEL
jgi:hypothetical protein